MINTDYNIKTITGIDTGVSIDNAHWRLIRNEKQKLRSHFCGSKLLSLSLKRSWRGVWLVGANVDELAAGASGVHTSTTISPCLAPSRSIVSKNSVFKVTLRIFAILCLLFPFVSIAASCATGANGKAKLASVRGNMRTIQIAAESYATDAGGKYPKTAEELAPYFPGGQEAPGGGVAGKMPINPFSGTNDRAVVTVNSPSTSAELESMRQQTSAAFTRLKPGQIGYSSVDNGKSYAITGTDENGNLISGLAGKPLILSCQ